jgi:hypothetical protein
MLKQSDIVGQIAQATHTAEQTFIFAAAFVAHAHVARNATFKVMHQHFATNDCCSSTECAHRIFARVALHKTAEAALLLLIGHHGRRWNDAREIGVTTGATWRSQW